MREKRDRAGEVQSRDDDALSSPSQQGNACMHSVATRKKVFTLHEVLLLLLVLDSWCLLVGG